MNIYELIPLLLPLLVIQLTLMIYALVDLSKRKTVTGGNKILWLFIIILLNMIGPIIYLVAGRKETINVGD